jgi:hypothetical protein
MLKQGNLLYKGGLPTSETWWSALENPTIALLPNTPASQNNYFIKTVNFETSLCSSNHIQRGAWVPRDLKVVPYSSTELEVKK